MRIYALWTPKVRNNCAHICATVPKELMANLTEILQTQLPLSTSACYTNSQVALYWIIGIGKEWKHFVQNRVSEIRRFILITSWNHSVSKGNPAAIPSRGLSMKELSASTLWCDSPEWLKGKKEQNNKVPQHSQKIPDGCTPQMKSKDRPSYILLVTEERYSLSQVMDC